MMDDEQEREKRKGRAGQAAESSRAGWLGWLVPERGDRQAANGLHHGVPAMPLGHLKYKLPSGYYPVATTQWDSTQRPLLLPSGYLTLITLPRPPCQH